MRFLNTRTYELYEQDELPDHGRPLPPYAVLSHTWLPPGNEGVQEVTYQDMRTAYLRLRHNRLKPDGWSKLVKYCDKAAADGFDWAWMDTCCIDKTNIGDTQEAINAMFRWYREASICYAYLADFTHSGVIGAEDLEREMKKSTWFSRGWTLQELLAPPQVVFVNHAWECLGTRRALSSLISGITGIGEHNLENFEPADLRQASLSAKLSWASAADDGGGG